MTTSIEDVDADRALKTKHRAMWALGDYPTVATDVIPDLGRVLVEACGVRPGDRVLDVAAGSGNAAIPAALAGAEVVACDLTPELLASGRDEAACQGAELEWLKQMPKRCRSQTASSTRCSPVWASCSRPHHQTAADELIRVCRSGGTIGLLSWTPEGFIGQMLATMKPYTGPPPPGTQPPPGGVTRTTCSPCWATGSPT